MNVRTIAWLGLWALVPAGCFNPDTSASGDLSDASSTGAGGDDSTGMADPDATGDPATTIDGASTGGSGGETAMDSTSSGGGSDSGESGSEPVIQCDDGIVVAGEVCFEILHERTGNNYSFGFLEDIDGDGDDDLVYSANNGEVVVQFNGNGQFGLETTSNFAGVTSLDTMGFLDFDGDGVRDGVLLSQAGGRFYTALGNTSGDYAITDSQFTEAYDVAMGDMDGDGDDEAVVLVLAGVQVWSIAGDGAMEQLDATAIGDFGAPRAVKLADLNSDDQLDVVYLGPFGDDAEDSEVRVQLGNGDGTLGGIELFPIVSTTDARDLALGDFDGDGEVDVAVADGATVGVVFGNGALAFSAADDLVVVSGNAAQVAAADVDLDGVDDLIVGYEDREALTVYRGGDGRVFAAGEDVDLPHVTETLSTGDVNGDGVPDIVVTSDGADALTVVHSTP